MEFSEHNERVLHRQSPTIPYLGQTRIRHCFGGNLSKKEQFALNKSKIKRTYVSKILKMKTKFADPQHLTDKVGFSSNLNHF